MTQNASQTNPPRIRVNIGYTLNTGDFESLRLDFGVEDSARPDETAQALSDRVYSFAEKQLLEKIRAAKTELSKK